MYVLLIICFIIIVFIVLSDRLIKIWAIENLIENSISISKDFIKIGKLKILDLTYVENDGAVFGSFSGMKWLLLGVSSILIVACMIILLKNIKNSKLFLISLSFIIGGGIGNLIDRFSKGYVVDYLEVKLFKFAVFNLADSFVVVGSILLFIFMIFFDKKNDETKKSSAEV